MMVKNDVQPIKWKNILDMETKRSYEMLTTFRDLCTQAEPSF